MKARLTQKCHSDGGGNDSALKLIIGSNSPNTAHYAEARMMLGRTFHYQSHDNSKGSTPFSQNKNAQHTKMVQPKSYRNNVSTPNQIKKQTIQSASFLHFIKHSRWKKPFIQAGK